MASYTVEAVRSHEIQLAIIAAESHELARIMILTV